MQSANGNRQFRGRGGGGGGGGGESGGGQRHRQEHPPGSGTTATAATSSAAQTRGGGRGYFRAYPRGVNGAVDDHVNRGSLDEHNGGGSAEYGEDEGDGFDGPIGLLGDLVALFSLCLLSLAAVGTVTVLLLLYAIVRPFSLPAYRRLSSALAAGPFLDASALLVPSVRICLAGDSDFPSPVGASVLVCNHLVEGDWWYVLMLGRCVGLNGSVKVFLRNEVLQGRRGEAASFGLATAAGAAAGSGTGATLTTAASAPTLLRNSESAVATGVTSTTSGAAAAAAAAAAAPTWASAAKSAVNGRAQSTGTSSSNDDDRGESDAPLHIRLGGHLLRTLLEFPLLSSESNRTWVQDRATTFALLRSFAAGGAPAPVQFLLFPEGWSLEGPAGYGRGGNGGGEGGVGGPAVDRRQVLAKSVEFAKREGRPQLRHLLLPRTTGFNASLESLRESSPVVYDVTMAFLGYDGSVPLSSDPSWPTLWRLVRGRWPREVHVRIKRYSMEEVLTDSQWLDQRWAEKDRLLGHFARHQSFPADPRGFCRHRAFNTRTHGVEGSLVALARLGVVPFLIPFLLFVSIPLCWLVLWLWLAHRAFCLVFPDWEGSGVAAFLGGGGGGDGTRSAGARRTPGSTSGAESLGGTPFFPATPFASPTHNLNWRSVSEPRLDRKEGDVSGRRG